MQFSYVYKKDDILIINNKIRLNNNCILIYNVTHGYGQ